MKENIKTGFHVEMGRHLIIFKSVVDIIINFTKEIEVHRISVLCDDNSTIIDIYSTGQFPMFPTGYSLIR